MISKKTYIPAKPRNRKLINVSGGGGIGRSDISGVVGNSHEHPNKTIIDQLVQQHLDVLGVLSIVDGNLKIDANAYSTGELSAYGIGSGGSSGGGGSIATLSDVQLTNPVSGNILQFNGTHWENRPQSSIVPDLTGYATEAWANNRFSLIGHTHNYIPLSQKGVANGVAELDATGHIPSSQLPSYVDDVLEFATTTNFPTTGETGKIYIALNTNLTYRWSGSGYVEISPSLALGETSSTAYRGDRGKIAYDHSQATGNPHNTTFAQLGSKPTTLSGYGITDAVTSTVFNDHKNNVNSEKHLTQAQLTNLINLSNWWKWDETNQAVYTEENVYSEKEISAYGAGSGGGGGAGALSELSDVNLTNPINTNLLQYNGSHWVNVPASSVGTPVSWGTTSNNTSPLTVSGVTKTVSLSGHLHAGIYEPAFTKNTAFNKNFGTIAGTVAEGNHTHSYLPLSGGTLTNNIGNILNLDTSGIDGSYIISKLNNVIKAYYGWHPTLGVFMQSGTAPNAAIGITDAQVPYFKTTTSGTVYNLWHAGNFNPASYLPLSGGTLTNNIGNILNLDTSGIDGSYIISKLNNVIKAYYGWHPTLGVFMQSGTAPNAAIGITDAQVPYFKTTTSGTVYNLWHAGNFNPASYLPLNGGTMTNTNLVTNLNADLLDGYHASNILKDLNANYGTTITSADDYPTNLLSGIHRTNIANVEYASILTGYDFINNYWQLRFRPSNGRDIYYRNSSSSSWSTIAFTDSNVASASQLQTSRTIWGQSFNGTGNVDGLLTVNYQNTWINSKLQLGRYDATAYSDRATIGVTNGNLHIDAYNGYAIYLNYYQGAGAGQTVVLQTNGNLGIGTTSPSQKLHVVGNILATGEITAYVASDRRLKENIKPITSALECINKLNPVTYNWNARALELNSNKPNGIDYGLIAQEVENVLPGVVHGIFDDKYKSIDYIKLIPIMIAAIKELKQKVNKL